MRKSKRGGENWALLKDDESRGKGRVMILGENENLSNKQNCRHGKIF
jgi:hypothetical protein